VSYASHIKKELVRVKSRLCCQRAELSALIKINGTISLSKSGIGLDFSTENAAIARRTLEIIKNIFPGTDTLLLSQKKSNLKKNNSYIVKIAENTEMFATNLGIMNGDGFVGGIAPDVIDTECCKRSYLRGAFLAGGSINNPGTSTYHFEILTKQAGHAEDLKKLLNYFDLNARILERKKGYITYIKESEKISDFLRVVGANNAVLTFEDIRIIRDIRNSDNRLNNCEIANETKTLNAADRQIEDILLINSVYGGAYLDEKLKYVADLRIEFPEENLTYLSEIASERGHKLSKSGINHRMRKITEMAKEIREN